MEDEKITLDRETFKTLASDTRVGILKSLKRRRKMLTELSKEFGMSPSTIKEHLDNLCRAELVIQRDDGHKWKYYELTGKGKDVLTPGETKIWVVLTLSVLAIIVTSYDFLQITFQRASPLFAAAGDAVGEVAKSLPPEAAAQPAYIPPYLPYWHVIGLVVFSIILGLSLGYVLGKRRFYTFQGE